MIRTHKRKLFFLLKIMIAATLSFCTFGSPSFSEPPHNSSSLEQIEDLKRIKESTRNQSNSGAKMFYDPINDVAGAVANVIYTQRDRSWVEACLIIYDIYRQLGGEKLKQAIFFQVKENLYYVSMSNKTASWYGSQDQALASFFFSLIRQSKVIAESASKTNWHEKYEDKALKIENILANMLNDNTLPVKLAVGETKELKFPESEIIIAGPAIQVHTPTKLKKGVSAKIFRTRQSKAGSQSVFGFLSNQKFRPKNQTEFMLTNDSTGNGYLEPSLTNPATEQKLSNGMMDRIGVSGEVKRYKLILNELQRVSISSTGPSDLIARISDKRTGKVLDTDDDGGKGYNFSISQPLQAGEYIIEVQHCCAGTGTFSLKLQTERTN
jgi:hypothetical protein